MNNTKVRSILIIVVSAFLVSILFNIRNFLIINISVFLLAILVANLLKLMRKMKRSED